MISSILKLSRFDANVIKFERKQINIKMLLDEILENMRSFFNIYKCNIIISGDNDISFIGDYKREFEALTNIIKNCIEHLNNNQKLSVYTEIIIEDDGLGIHPKDLKHIFERFYKGTNSSKDSIGIGLSLAKDC